MDTLKPSSIASTEHTLHFFRGTWAGSKDRLILHHLDPAAPWGGCEVGQRRELRQRIGALHNALRPANQQPETLQISIPAGGGADVPQVLLYVAVAAVPTAAHHGTTADMTTWQSTVQWCEMR